LTLASDKLTSYKTALFQISSPAMPTSIILRESIEMFSQRIFLEGNKTMYVGEKVEGSTKNDNERGMWGEQSRDGKRKGPRIRVHGDGFSSSSRCAVHSIF
jgi:hypothetical protein